MTSLPIAPAVARRIWRMLEPIHAVLYFAPEVADAITEAGLKGWRMGYFAGRSAPMGAVGPGVVIATFYNFKPSLVARAIPDAWSFASPSKVLEARLAGVDAALRRALGDGVDGDGVVEAAALARMAIEGALPEGRPIFAGNADLPWPAEPHLALWHAATLIREHRGDGHVDVLAAAGLTGLEAHITMTGTGAVSRQIMQSSRGWTDEEWEAASAKLRDRHWLDAEGALTEEGKRVRKHIEDQTDELAVVPLSRLGPENAARLEELARPIARIVTNEVPIPLPNPTGLTQPS